MEVDPEKGLEEFKDLVDTVLKVRGIYRREGLYTITIHYHTLPYTTIHYHTL